MSLLQQSQASVPLSFIIWHTSEEEIEVIFVVKVVICKKIFSPNLEEKVDCAHRRVLRVGGDGGGDLGDNGDDLGAAGGGSTRGRVGKAVHLR